jgi:hypothetical protein
MEPVRSDRIAGLGFSPAAFERAHGVAFVAGRVEIGFLRPARLNDTLEVTVEPLGRGASRGSPRRRCAAAARRSRRRASSSPALAPRSGSRREYPSP